MKDQVNGADPTAVLENRLELVQRAADDFAHELKNPLHSMVINLEVLRRRIGRLDEPAQADVIRYVDVLGGELDRLSHRLEVLLRLLRPGRGDDPIPINELIEELWELVQLEAGRSAVSVEFVPASPSGNGRVPREPTRQVILNLVLDLLDPLRAGERLEVRTEVDEREVKVVFAAAPAPENRAFHTHVSTSDRRDRVRIARVLSQSIGGRIDVPERASTTTLLLTLPRTA